MSRKKFSNILSSFLGLLISAATGFFCGYAILDYVDKLGLTLPLALLALAAGFALLAFSMLLQIIIHEAGHLLFGLISGYHFVSFRIGSYILVKGPEDKLSLKRFHLAGTAGQCLMSPPDFEEDGYLPVGLYNMGGVLLNAISALVFFWAYYLSGGTVILPMFFLCLGIVGLGLALMNGLPLILGGVPNDGYNALSLGKDEEALKAFWVQLSISRRLSLGHGLKDMPQDWFTKQDYGPVSSPLGASLAVFKAQRLLELHLFSQAEELMDSLLAAGNIPDIYVNLLGCDKLFLQALKHEPRQPEKTLEKFMLRMKNYPSVLRTRYALALSGGSMAAAQEYRQALDLLDLSYPYSGELAVEKELADLAGKELTPAAEPAR